MPTKPTAQEREVKQLFEWKSGRGNFPDDPANIRLARPIDDTRAKNYIAGNFGLRGGVGAFICLTYDNAPYWYDLDQIEWLSPVQAGEGEKKNDFDKIEYWKHEHSKLDHELLTAQQELTAAKQEIDRLTGLLEKEVKWAFDSNEYINGIPIRSLGITEWRTYCETNQIPTPTKKDNNG